jgi:8-oxo-dGTP pyrophosphatase MutT (NUDIX family)
MPVTLAEVRAALRRGRQGGAPAGRMAAIAGLLTPGLDLMFMLRAEFPGDPWSGHVSFPGGRVDPGDASPLAAARRETSEELGIDLGAAELLGELDEVAPVSGVLTMAIRPFVFALDREPEIRANREVASVHRLPLDALLANVGRGRMTFVWKGQDVEMPCVDFDGVRLWGLTLRVVDDLLDRIDGGGTGWARGPHVSPAR